MSEEKRGESPQVLAPPHSSGSGAQCEESEVAGGGKEGSLLWDKAGISGGRGVSEEKRGESPQVLAPPLSPSLWDSRQDWRQPQRSQGSE